MRVAVFSDIHGNPFSCEAVLDSIASDGYFDEVVVAGDLCLGGSDPSHCIDLLRKAGVLALYGNTDEYIFAPEKPPGDDLHLRKWDRILKQVFWTHKNLGEKRIKWLHEIPFDFRISPTSDPKDDLIVFHANPKTVEEMILPPIQSQLDIWGEVRQPDDDAKLEELLGDVNASMLAFGHFHFTSSRKWKDKTLVNVSPCSQPAHDKDSRARYTIFEWKNKQWTYKRKYIPYDYRQELRALQYSGMPGWEDYARTFPNFDH